MKSYCYYAIFDLNFTLPVIFLILLVKFLGSTKNGKYQILVIIVINMIFISEIKGSEFIYNPDYNKIVTKKFEMRQTDDVNPSVKVGVL